MEIALITLIIATPAIVVATVIVGLFVIIEWF